MWVTAVAAAIAAVAGLFVAREIDLRNGGDIVIESAPSQAAISVWIEGAVATPGVYRLDGDARLNDAVAAAGGLTDDADLSRLNLASRVIDEQHIVIPRTAAAGSAPSPAAGTAAPGTRVRVNINTASEAELDTLPGIGPTIAARIVAYREAHGPFNIVDELARVEGISPKMVDELRDLITVGP